LPVSVNLPCRFRRAVRRNPIARPSCRDRQGGITPILQLRTCPGLCRGSDLSSHACHGWNGAASSGASALHPFPDGLHLPKLSSAVQAPTDDSVGA